MSQHYIVLRMASSRHLHDETQSGTVGPRPRYYSTPSDLRDVSPISRQLQHQHRHYSQQQPLPFTASTGRLSIASNRMPNLRRTASAAVRSTSAIAELSAAADGTSSRPSATSSVPRALRCHGHDTLRGHDRSVATDESTLCDKPRSLRRVLEQHDARSDAGASSCDDNDLADELQVIVEDDRVSDIDTVADDCMLTTWQRAKSMRLQGNSSAGMRYNDEPFDTVDDAEDGAVSNAWRLSKETMFVVAAWVVLFTSGGLILGFGPIYAALVREGQWSELCRDPHTDIPLSPLSTAPCARQEIHLQYVFSTSFLCLSAANACFGIVLDIFGPRLTALSGLALACAGNVALASGDSATGSGNAIIAGYALIGAGGMGSYLAAFQLLQLYRVQGVVCSTLSSLFNCSGYVYMALQIDGVTRQAFFRSYSVLVAVCMAMCFVLFPTNSIVRPAETLAIPGFRIQWPRIKTPTGLVDGMKQQLSRGDLWYFAVFFGWISLIFAFAGGAIPSLLVALAGDDARAAGVYTSILYPVIVNGTFVYSPLVGFVIDRYGFKTIFFACLALVQLFITLLLVPSLHVQLLTFVVYSMAQACLYSLQFAYIMMCFPAELNGTLQAFMATVSFAFGLLNYLLNPWAQTNLHGDYTVVLTVLALPTLLLYVFVDVVQGCEDQIVHDDDDGDDGGGIAAVPLPILSPSNEMSKLI